MKTIELPFKVKKPILACGADLKGAFALAKGKKAFLSESFGDLSDPDDLEKYENSIKAEIKKLGIYPEIIAYDLHPGYFSTRFAESYPLSAKRHTLIKVQHHQAHIASAIVDNNIKGNVIGVAFDGTGYGLDGNIWGGEFFVGNLNKFIRAAHLEYVAMPGADAAIREPWRMAASYLYYAYGKRGLTLQRQIPLGRVRPLLQMIDKNINCPLTSSAGRLFDAVGSMILGKGRVSKEAELPIEMEKLISPRKRGSYKFRFRPDTDGVIIETAGIIKGIVKDLSDKIEGSEISCKFHNTIADVITKTVLMMSKQFKVKQAVLSGGVFQNRYLTASAVRSLTSSGIRVYTHSGIATNDSGIPLGQIAIANERGS